MINWAFLISVLMLATLGSVPAFAQVTIPVNQTTPCFLNYTAGPDMWRNCGASEDYLAFALLPWEWVTGGYFSMIFVALFMGISYIKYHKVIYPMLIGVLFLPIALALFPDAFQSWAFIMLGLGIGVSIIYIILKATKEY